MADEFSREIKLGDKEALSGRNDWMKMLEELESYEPPAEDAAPLETEPAASAAPQTPPPAPPQAATPAPPPVARPATPISPVQNKVIQTPQPDAPTTPSAPAPAPAERKPLPTRRPSPNMSRYEELCKKPSMTIKREDLKVIDELSEILGSVNTALRMLQGFEKTYEHNIPKQKFRLWEENLKDTAMIMYREFHALRNGKQQKTYDKRCICTCCHGVFMVPLPDGLCDECRSRKTTKSAAPY